jgi:large-conductance mechanosensitive channel
MFKMKYFNINADEEEQQEYEIFQKKYRHLVNTVMIFLLLCLIVGFWIVYQKGKIHEEQKKEIEKMKKEGIGATTPVTKKDSLTQVYNSTLQTINDSLPASVTNNAAQQTQMAEVATLKTEIGNLLASENTSPADLTIAKIKIEQLQLKVAILQNKYIGVEEENKKLQAQLNLLLQQRANASSSNNTASETVAKNTSSSSTSSEGKETYVDALQLYAVGDNGQTNNVDDAEKLVGSFVFSNKSKNPSEVMIVVTQPDGKVVKNSVWESGSFETKQGKKLYSRKMYIDAAAEDKQVSFSLTPQEVVNGNYTMQVWQNGNLLANKTKRIGL